MTKTKVAPFYLGHGVYNNWQSVYFLCFQTPPKCRVVRRPNLARKRVTTMRRTSVGFYVYRGRYEKNDIFLKMRPDRPTVCCGESPR